jgi:hypothetical protein
MKLSKTILAVLATGVISCGLFSQQVQAVQINGDIDFSGNVTFNTSSLATATSVTQFRTVFGVAGGLNVSGTSGSFTSVPLGTFAAFQTPYVFNPTTAYPTFWQVGGFTFNLLNSTVINQNAFFLEVRGVGIITGNGFDPTPGTWSFTSTSSNGGSNNTFGFAANTASIPDGGSALALLGIALVGVEALRRKFATA